MNEIKCKIEAIQEAIEVLKQKRIELEKQLNELRLKCKHEDKIYYESKSAWRSDEVVCAICDSDYFDPFEFKETEKHLLRKGMHFDLYTLVSAKE